MKYVSIYLRKYSIILFLLCAFYTMSGQSNQLNQCSILDSIFSHIGDLFPERPYTRALRLYDISGKNNFKNCNEHEYGIWNIYYFDQLTFDINSGGSVDFVILKDEIADNSRTIRFFYAQAFCEKNIRHKRTGYIVLDNLSQAINILRISSYYLD